MRSEDLLWSLTQLTETLFALIADKNASHLEVAEHIVDDALHVIYIEGEDCLHTDQTLNKLQKLFEESWKAINVLYEHHAWSDLHELTVQLIIVRDELQEQLTLVTKTKDILCP